MWCDPMFISSSCNYYQGCSLGLDVSVSRRSRDVASKGLGLVSVSWKRRKVSVSVSILSRTENRKSQSRLGLVPQGLVYKPMCTAFCFIAKLHVHHFEYRASILFTDSQANVSFIVAYICNCSAIHNSKSPFPRPC